MPSWAQSAAVILDTKYRDSHTAHVLAQEGHLLQNLLYTAMLVVNIYTMNVEWKVASSLINWGLDAMTTLLGPLYYKGLQFLLPVAEQIDTVDLPKDQSVSLGQPVN